MLPIALAVTTTLISGVGADANCLWSFGVSDADTSVWKVDDDLLSQMSITDAPTLTSEDLRLAFDAIIQNMARSSRAKMRHRVIIAECAPGSAQCISGVMNVQDPVCNAEPNTQARAGVGGLGNAGWVRVCVENREFAWKRGKFDKVMAHEIGHAFGLAHPHGAVTACSDMNSPHSCNGTSDGCEGELMCGNVNCAASSIPGPGDRRALRRTNQGDLFKERRVYVGSSTTTLSQPVAVAVPSSAQASETVYAPRIDCATDVGTCVVAVTRSSGAAPHRVYRFTNWNAGTGTFDSIALLSSWGPEPLSPVDVAINKGGTKAWAIYSGSASVSVRELNIATSTVSEFLISSDSATLPPRVAFNSDLGAALAISVTENPSPGNPDVFCTPRWRLRRLASYAIDLNFGSLDDACVPPAETEQSERFVVSDFDFTCAPSSGLDVCTLVANLRADDAGTVINGAFYTLRFTVDPTYGTVTILGGGWHQSGLVSNAIVGATSVGQQLVVSASRAITSATSTSNTRLVRYSTDSSLGFEQSVALVRSDAPGCASTTSFGAASMHGGYSVAWCPMCSSRLVSVHMGEGEDGDGYCF